LSKFTQFDEQKLAPATPGFVPDKPDGQGFVSDGFATPGFVPDPEIGTGRRLLATAARIIPPVAGFGIAGPAGGGIGGTLGETAAQLIEAPTEPLKLAPIAGAAGLGALPFGKISGLVGAASRTAKALGGAAEGALFGAGGAQVEKITREGRPATLGETAFGAGVGTVLGGAAGAARFDPRKAPPKITTLKAAQLVADENDLGPNVTRLGLPAVRTPAARGMFEKATPGEIDRARLTDQAIRQEARDARGLVQVLAPHEIDFTGRRMQNAIFLLDQLAKGGFLDFLKGGKKKPGLEETMAGLRAEVAGRGR